ncbi:MAG: galactosyldiacylglycerol synthase, partial [Chloroflexi bacterium]
MTNAMNRQPIDVLFAISDTGGGHRSAAVAISAALEQMSGASITWAIEDLLQATNVPGVRSAPGLYDQLSTRWLKLYNFSFQLTNSQSTVSFLSRIV